MRGWAEAWVLGQDLLLQPQERRVGVEAGILQQDLAHLVQRAQSVRLSSGAVERGHAQLPEPLPRGVGAAEGFELLDRGAAAPEGQLCREAFLEQVQTQLLEPRLLRLCPRQVSEAAEGLAPPEVERFPERQGGSDVVTHLGRPPALGAEALDLVDVQASGGHLQAPASRRSLERPASLSRDGLPQARDVGLHRAVRRPRRILRPEGVDSRVDRHAPARVEGEVGDERPLLRASQPRVGARAVQLERPQQLQLHGRNATASGTSMCCNHLQRLAHRGATLLQPRQERVLPCSVTGEQAWWGGRCGRCRSTPSATSHGSGRSSTW